MYNKVNDAGAMATQQWLNLALILIMIVMIQLMRRQKRITAASCDARDISASDYTLMVENVPKDSNKEDLKRLFEDQESFNESNDKTKKIQFKVTKINLSYNLKDLSE